MSPSVQAPRCLISQDCWVQGDCASKENGTKRLISSDPFGDVACLLRAEEQLLLGWLAALGTARDFPLWLCNRVSAPWPPLFTMREATRPALGGRAKGLGSMLRWVPRQGTRFSNTNSCFPNSLLGLSGASIILKQVVKRGCQAVSPPSPRWSSATERSCQCSQVSVSVR